MISKVRYIAFQPNSRDWNWVETVPKIPHFEAVLYPTPWQRKTLWSAITCVSLVVIVAVIFLTALVATRTVLFTASFGTVCDRRRSFLSARTAGQLARPAWFTSAYRGHYRICRL